MRTKAEKRKIEEADQIIGRLRQIFGVSNNAELAAALNTRKSTISSWRTRGVPDSVCADVAAQKQVSLDWLRNGSEGNGRAPGLAVQMEEYVGLPVYDLRAAAGHGKLVEREEIIDVLKFKRSWIELELHANPTDLALLHVDGDSMEPVLHPGDTILIDRRDTGPNRDAIYVMRIDDALLVKRLQRLPGGQLRVMSDNARYEPFLLKMEQLESVVIVGRVVWAGRRM